MDEQFKTIENKVNEILNHLLKSDAVQEAIHNILDVGFKEKTPVNPVAKVCTDLESFFSEECPPPNDGPHSVPPLNQDTTKDLKDNIQVVHEVGVRTIVNFLANRKNHLQAELIARLLHYLSTNKIVSSKIVCNSLLAHNFLKPYNSTFWLITFKLIKLIISGVDYKGVREIMKNCLEKAVLLPAHLKHSQLEQAEVLCDLLQTIFSRSNALLPGYFIVNELLKLYPDFKTGPHWKLSGMLTSFIDEFRKAAQMLTIIGRHRLKPIVEHASNTSPSISSWKLDCNTLCFPLKGSLPYAASVKRKQTRLLSHVLQQPYSKEMAIVMLDFQKKQRYILIEEQFVDLLIRAMEECEKTGAEGGPESLPPQCLCSHVLPAMIHFALSQFVSFKFLCQGLHDKLRVRSKLPKGRDHLMWTLLQYLSGTISKHPVTEFQPVLRLIELLYPEREPLEVPNCSDPRCSLQLSAMCILIHILRKAQLDNLNTPHRLPYAFTKHHEFLQNLVHNPQGPLLTPGFPTLPTPDYRIALLLNAYSTNQEVFHRQMWQLCEVIFGNQKSTVAMPGSNCVALGSTTPFDMTFLDNLTVHVKMSIMQQITGHITKHSQNKTNPAQPPAPALAPALVETYARMLVYLETESIGIRPFTHQVLSMAFKNQSWGILHALLELFTYRVHHTMSTYRITLLSTIHHMATPLNNVNPYMNQLYLCMENSALRLITGLGNTEVMPNFTRYLNPESKSTIISSESEELNRVIVLTMARAIHVIGCDSSGESPRWCVDFLKAVMNHTPHTWASHTLQCFPPVVADFYKQHGAPRDTQNLKKAVEDEYRKWCSMSNENDMVAHFSHQHASSNLFLCILFKMVFDTTRVPAEAYKVLERLGPRQLMAHVRTLCDFLVLEFSNSSLGQHLSKCVDTMNAIIWQFNIVPIDRLILCLALRTQEGSSEAQVCLFIIQLLLLRPNEFRHRLNEFVAENSPEHWKQQNWYEKHMAFHRKFPEKYAPESLLGGQSPHYTLPIYFSNVCLRFLPVLDIMIHRFLEVHQVHKRLETVLDQLGSLYKFHDRPITYLYNTLHYYEEKLRESPLLKRQLVSAVIMSQKDIRAEGWALTTDFINYLSQPQEEINWKPGMRYFVALIKRLVQTLNGRSAFPNMDWRFNEFANAGAHALHVTCVELVALPANPPIVAGALIDALIKGFYEIPSSEVMDWVNGLGLILAWLPEAYWAVLHDRIVELIQSPDLTCPSTPGGLKKDPFSMLDLEALLATMGECQAALIVALVHSFWTHASYGQIAKIPDLMKDRLIPILKHESQLIVLCQLVAPFLQRFSPDNSIYVVSSKQTEVAIQLYEALASVDAAMVGRPMVHEDAVCDLLYHIKYMFTGDSIKGHVEPLIRKLRPSLKIRLRFITHLNIEEIENSSRMSETTTISTTTTTAAATTTNAALPSTTSSIQNSPLVSTAMPVNAVSSSTTQGTVSSTSNGPNNANVVVSSSVQGSGP